MVVSFVVDATTLASQGLVLELLFSVIRYYFSTLFNNFLLIMNRIPFIIVR